jgi:hypothetical protein
MNKHELVNLILVTPRVSNPHDYVNDMFKRPYVLMNFQILSQIQSFPNSEKCGPLRSVVDFSELI